MSYYFLVVVPTYEVDRVLLILQFLVTNILIHVKYMSYTSQPNNDTFFFPKNQQWYISTKDVSIDAKEDDRRGTLHDHISVKMAKLLKKL